ncbi:MAG: DUF309 domain-containing protein [Desulfoferrobacter sp.]
MKSNEFDPFANRLARDIRNELSSAFVRALQEADTAPFEDVSAAYMKLDLAPPYRNYIEKRTEKYQEVFSEIQKNRIEDPFAQAMALWDKGLLFEVHERLEVFWKEESAEVQQAIKGIIKAVAAHVHMQYGHTDAALRLAQKANASLRSHGKALPSSFKTEVVLKSLEDLTSRSPKVQNQI